jgi:hypothetical protein
MQLTNTPACTEEQRQRSIISSSSSQRVGTQH